MAVNVANEARELHAFLCEHPDCGYSWSPRWGEDGYYTEFTTSSGRSYTVRIGSYDCSSSTCYAWQLALTYTDYDGALDGATYTGNMRSVFVNSGLFEVWDTYSTEAYPGDLYLNEESHVAMCQGDGRDGSWDSLSEFSWGDNGAYGNQFGDQTGWESHITDFYSYPWDCTLHYNGAADSGEVEPQPGPSPAPVPSEQEWQGELIGLSDTTGAGDDYAGVFGKPLLYVAIEGVGAYQAHKMGQPESNWLPAVSRYDLDDEEYGMAGDGVPIDAIRISDPTVFYQTHNKGGDWNDVMHGTMDTGGTTDDFAGEYGIAQDAIRIWRENGSQPRYNVYS